MVCRFLQEPEDLFPCSCSKLDFESTELLVVQSDLIELELESVQKRALRNIGGSHIRLALKFS